MCMLDEARSGGYVLCVRLDREMRAGVMVDRNILEILHPLIFSCFTVPHPKNTISYDGESSGKLELVFASLTYLRFFFLIAHSVLGSSSSGINSAKGGLPGGVVNVCVGELMAIVYASAASGPRFLSVTNASVLFFLRTSLPLSRDQHKAWWSYVIYI